MTAARRAADANAAPGACPSLAPSGAHWLVDAYEVPASRLADASALEALLRDAAVAAGAQVLSSHFHRFAPVAAVDKVGVTGVVLLAESHITVHTWPEHGFAAIDLFLCGSAEPRRAIATIERGLGAKRMVTHGYSRGGDGPTSGVRSA